MTEHKDLDALIEEHRGVIAAFGDMSPIGNLARRTIRALETVFEAHVKELATSPERVKIGADSSHVTSLSLSGSSVTGSEEVSTPTDDERANRRDDFDAADEAFKKRDKHATWGDAEDRDAAVLWHWRGFQDGADSVRRTVQGEPTDAQVRAALEALGHSGSGVTPLRMRAALRAAAATPDLKEEP